MTTLTISKPAVPGFWSKVLRALRAFDEAVHYDPAEALHRKIERLETRLQELETGARRDSSGQIQTFRTLSRHAPA